VSLVADRQTDDGLARFLLRMRTGGHVDPRLMAAFEQAPRDRFVPKTLRGEAWRAISLPLDCGQEMGPPARAIRVAAYAAALKPKTIYEVGTGSGWQTAILAGLCQRIVTVERFRTLADAARLKLARHASNAEVRHGDGLEGDPAGGGFDLVVLNGSVEEWPGPVLAQLLPRGLLIGARGTPGGETAWMTVERGGAGFQQRSFGDGITDPIGPLQKGRARAL
jgi:protein-L-isoaspartate(D-aspartate) O-methyltransferase